MKKSSNGASIKHAASADENARLYAMFYDAPAIIAKFSGPNHVIEFANRMYYKLYQSGFEPAIGKTIREALPEMDPEVFDVIDQVYRSGQKFYCKEAEVMLDPEGDGNLKKRYFDTIYQPSFDENEKVNGVLIHASDVTELVNSRDKAKETAAINHAIMENTSTPHFMIDKDGVCRFKNPAAKYLLAMTPNEAITERKFMGEIFTCAHLKEGKEDECELIQAVDYCREADGEEKIERVSDGEQFHASFRVSPVKSANRGCSIVRIRDITEEMQARERKARLDAVTKERDQLASLNSIKDEFISTASHQLRTPATGVKQYIGFLKEGLAGELNEDQQSYVDQAYASNDRQLYVIDELLRVARLDSQHYYFKPAAVNVTNFIKGLKKDIEQMLVSNNHEFEINNKVSSDLVVKFDKAEIKHVLLNIIDNARKYSQPGTKIVLNVQVSANKRRLQFAVKDKGLGIEQKDIEKIFQKFISVNNQYSGSVDSSGLGLYIAKKIVKKHGGQLSVESSPGDGSTFTVSLPLLK